MLAQHLQKLRPIRSFLLLNTRYKSTKSSPDIKKGLELQDFEVEGIAPPIGDPSWSFFTESDTQDDTMMNEEEEERDFQRGSQQIKFCKFGDKLVTLPKELKNLVYEKVKTSNKELIRTNTVNIFASIQSLSNLNMFESKDTDKPHKKFHNRAKLSNSSPHTLSYSSEECLAYLAAVMPCYYACTHRVLSEVKTRVPALSPKSILDFGTGPGTAMWAAKEVYGAEAIQVYHGVDLSESMLDVAEELITSTRGLVDGFQGKVVMERHFSYRPDLPKYDLVLSCFTLSELPNDNLRLKAIESLLESCNDTLVIIERGTPKGFDIVSQARTLALEQGMMYTVAPCPHDKPCPMINSTRWCHFQQKLQRPKYMMDAKRTKANQELANYSYVVLRKNPRPTSHLLPRDAKEWIDQSYQWGRIIDRPNKRGGHVNLATCSSNGSLESTTLTKSQGTEVYRDARKASWSDLFPHASKSAAQPIKLQTRGKKNHNEVVNLVD